MVYRRAVIVAQVYESVKQARMMFMEMRIGANERAEVVDVGRRRIVGQPREVRAAGVLQDELMRLVNVEDSLFVVDRFDAAEDDDVVADRR